MNPNPTAPIPANGSPVFSIAGDARCIRGRPEAAYPNPDALVAAPPSCRARSTFTIAGVVAGTPQTAWRTAMPDPPRDTPDAYGHIITKVEAAARAELAALRPNVLALRAARNGEVSKAA